MRTYALTSGTFGTEPRIVRRGSNNILMIAISITRLARVAVGIDDDLGTSPYRRPSPG
jgi:hypothetical protein